MTAITVIFILVILVALAMVYLYLSIIGLKEKLKSAIFLDRKGDLLFFVDGKGNKVSERIIIEHKK
jgi:hypothetical protein